MCVFSPAHCGRGLKSDAVAGNLRFLLSQPQKCHIQPERYAQFFLRFIVNMEKMEKYFKEKGCGFLLVDVFEYNEIAKKYYKKLGYNTRNIEMCKKIE